MDATARGVTDPPARLVRTLTPPSLIRIRPANSDDDARFIVDTLLEAGRDVSADASPFGLGALMESPLFQQRQLDSSMRKVGKTTAQRAVDARANRAHALQGGSCLWIAEAPTGERLGSIGVMEASAGSQAEVAAYAGVERCERLGELTSFYVAKSERGQCDTLLIPSSKASAADTRRAARRGLGRRLLRHALRWAASRGYDTLVLYVWRQAEAARALYREHGFVTRRQSYGPGDAEEDDIMVCQFTGTAALESPRLRDEPHGG
eukprot:COSAG04_NODE_1525_length_6462_cov_57.387239_4_plen_264_part_00